MEGYSAARLRYGHSSMSTALLTGILAFCNWPHVTQDGQDRYLQEKESIESDVDLNYLGSHVIIHSLQKE